MRLESRVRPRAQAGPGGHRPAQIARGTPRYRATGPASPAAASPQGEAGSRADGHPAALARRRMGICQAGRPPAQPNTDYHEWKALLTEAGVREARLHDARHTAATVLAILAVPTPTAMAIMGWSSATMATRYQHILDSIRKGVADQVGGLLWGTADDSAARA